MGAALKFRQTDVPKQAGELARLKVVQGPDYGTLFVLMAPQASIGRGEDNDIVIADLKASRRHALFSFQTGLGWSLSDNGSSNGIGYQGREVRRINLGSNSIFSLGETSFEFVTSDQPTRVLLSAPRPAELFKREQSAFDQQRQRVRELGSARRAAPIQGIHSPKDSGGSSGKLVLPLLGAIAAIYFLGGEGKAPSVRKKGPSGETGRETASVLPPQVDDGGESSKAAAMFFREGFREYREKNFLRAKINFENVLQLAPGHQLARLYLDNSLKAIEDEISSHLEQGKKSANAGRVRSAKRHFEAVLRLLARDPSSPKYSEAKEALEKIELELKGGAG